MPGREVQELGQILRQTRLDKGLSLMQAQQATKIRQSFLAALEEDDYSILPPPVYVRGFIKNYARYLGLSSDEMGLRFDELLENVAAGYDGYGTGYGSTDSGGALPPAAVNPQMLVGLSQGEARMVERGSEMINLTQLDASDVAGTNPPANLANTEDISAKPPVALGSADSGGMARPVRRLQNLRVPEKYVLKPAIQPINKPSFYLPNFAPMLLVLIIVGAAFLIAYRGLAVPPKEQTDLLPTATPNVYSKATVTPFATSEIAAVINSSADNSATRPAYFTPDPALANRITPSAAASLPTALSDTTPTPSPSPSPTLQALSVDITAVNGQSWLVVTVDGQERYNKLLAAGQTVNFEGKRVVVRAGAPGAIKVKVNGQDKQYALPGSDIITHTWDVNGEDKIST